MRPVRKRPDSWIGEAPARCSASRDIAASPASIWSVLVDHEAWPEWFKDVRKIEVAGKATGVGVRRTVYLRGLTIDEEIVAWEVDERFSYSSVALSRGIFETINGRVTIDDRGSDGARVTYTQGYAPAWWFRFPFALMKRRLERNLGGALESLSVLVE